MWTVCGRHAYINTEYKDSRKKTEQKTEARRGDAQKISYRWVRVQKSITVEISSYHIQRDSNFVT
jgi:hypothetical protein